MEREPYSVRELSVRTFSDFETLAIKQGGCWCIFYQRANPLRPGTTSEEWKRRNRSDKRRWSAAAAPTRSWSTRAVRRSVGASTAARRSSLGSTHDVPTAKSPRESGSRSCGGSRASSSIRSIEGEVLRSSPCVLRSIRSGAKEEVSWKRTLWLHRRWQPCRSGVGSGRRGCSARKASAPSHPSGQAAFSCGKRLHLDAQRNLNSGPPIQRVAGR